VLLDQLRNPQSAASLAPAARDLQHGDLAGDVTVHHGVAFHPRFS
jgi:hypothetical protein